MAYDNLDKLFDKIQNLVRPLKEDIEVIKSKVSKLDAHQGVMSIEIRSMRDQQSVINDKLDALGEEVDEGFKNLDEKAEGILEFAHNIEKERHKNTKRISHLEEKLGIAS